MVYTIPESQGYVDVCTRLYAPFGMDLTALNLTISLGFSQGNSATSIIYNVNLVIWMGLPVQHAFV